VVCRVQVEIKLGGLRSFLTYWMAVGMLVGVRVTCKGWCGHQTWVTIFSGIRLASIVTVDGTCL